MILIKHPDTRAVTTSKAVIEWQWQTLLSIGRSYVYRNHLSALLTTLEDGPHKTAIIQTHNTHFSQLLIEWCKIFGSPKNKIHWQKAFKGLSAGKNQVFCTRKRYTDIVKIFILQSAEINNKEYKKAVGTMKNARNKYVAHCDIGQIPQMPFLETPYAIANSYSAFLSGAQGHNIAPLSEHQALFESEAQAAFPLPA